mmetsp:Transcript_28343/g.45711  ORF Transcript_28343/g.45711 Transcript_28343/m.45711 type:complete len:1066 (+) Transcript_28343:64-3261(+)
MLRLNAQASKALPPISQLEVFSDGEGWTVTERRRSNRKAATRRTGSPGAKPEQTALHWENGNAPLEVQPFAKTLLEPTPLMQMPTSMAEVVKMAAAKAKANGGKLVQDTLEDDGPGPAEPSEGTGGAVMDPGAKKPSGQSLKGKTVTNWLNHTLGQATHKLDNGVVASAAAKQAQGLAHFGIDNAALERLGLDHQAADRVYRAMFVYSQGLHAVLQEAVGRAKNSWSALLVLWRAFQAVLEQAGQSDEHGSESLAALVQRGNEEEKERVEGQFRDQINALQAQVERLTRELRSSKDELQRVKEDEMRMRNESEKYKTDFESTEKRYEVELKKRGDAEVKYLDKVRECEALEENLNKKEEENLDLKERLYEELASNAKARQENDILSNQNKVLDGQVQSLRQQVQEASIYKQRLEQQVGLLKQQMEQTMAKTAELQDQLDIEQEANKKLTEQISLEQRQCRRMERELEDEQHMRKEMENERNLLRDKLTRLEKQELTLIEDRRNLQKQLNDLNLVHRSAQIELTRKAEHLERAEKTLHILQENHQQLQDAHRAMGVEVDNLREDVHRMDDQLHRETTLRKSLQEEKKTLMAQVQNLVVQLETSRLAVDSTQRELVDVTDHKVRLEGILRDTKSAMQKVTLEQQIEQKSHAQRTAMLEKVISDERAERRNLVNETLEVNSQRDDTLDCLRRAQNEITEIKRQRLENEEEIERLKVMLQAQEHRNTEQLVTIDKYHAVVASHEAEVHQIQMLLECEREEAARKMAELQDAFAAAQKSLEQRLDQYRFSYEDLRALICLREDEKSKEAERAKRNSLEEQVRKLNAQMDLVQEEAASNLKRAQNAETQVRQRNMQIDDLHDGMKKVRRERDEWREKLDRVLPDVEHSSMEREDSLMQYERIKHSTEIFEEVRSSLERQLAQAKMEIQRLVAAMQRHTADASTQVLLSVGDGQVQTDLSYQYLEQADHLQGDRWRRDRLDSLKRASNFVDDQDERRDFTVIMRTTAPPVAQLGPEAASSSFPRPGGDTWPRPPMATPSVSSQKIQAMRRSFPSAGSAGLHVAQVKTAGATS